VCLGAAGAPPTSEEVTMQAIVQDRYGPPDVLELRDVEPPAIGDDDVLVRVHAAGVDRGVWHVMAGQPYLIRIMGYGLRAPRSRVRGFDFAGRVTAAGRNVRSPRVGDEVFGAGDGSFAEYVCAKARNCAPRPASLTFVEAAAVPISGVTALQAVRDHGAVAAGHQVLVLGAGGGVGHFAVQIARALGATVTGVCSTAKADTVRAIGAARVIDYTRDDVTRAAERWDVIIDTAGNRPLRHLRRILAPAGTLVIVGGEGGDRWFGGMGRPLRAQLLSRFVRHNLRFFIATVRQDDLRFLTELIEGGKLKPVIDRTYPLRDAAEAVRHLAAGRVRGKVVITLAPA
jgi:NADPH:quinone reductase-like Zn-dependent oxidoreductase